MSLVIVKCINNLIMSLAIIFTTMYLTDEKIKLLSINTVFWIFISISPCFVFYDPGYDKAEAKALQLSLALTEK